MRLLETTDKYAITAHVEPELSDMRDHFVRLYGWTEDQFAEIEGYDWFCVRVTLTDVLTNDSFDSYLGACCAKCADQYIAEDMGGYLPDLMDEVKRDYLKTFEA